MDDCARTILHLPFLPGLAAPPTRALPPDQIVVPHIREDVNAPTFRTMSLKWGIQQTANWLSQPHHHSRDLQADHHRRPSAAVCGDRMTQKRTGRGVGRMAESE